MPKTPQPKKGKNKASSAAAAAAAAARAKQWRTKKEMVDHFEILSKLRANDKDLKEVCVRHDEAFFHTWFEYAYDCVHTVESDSDDDDDDEIEDDQYDRKLPAKDKRQETKNSAAAAAAAVPAEKEGQAVCRRKKKKKEKKQKWNDRPEYTDYDIYPCSDAIGEIIDSMRNNTVVTKFSVTFEENFKALDYYHLCDFYKAYGRALKSLKNLKTFEFYYDGMEGDSQELHERIERENETMSDILDDEGYSDDGKMTNRVLNNGYLAMSLLLLSTKQVTKVLINIHTYAKPTVDGLAVALRRHPCLETLIVQFEDDELDAKELYNPFPNCLETIPNLRSVSYEFNLAGYTPILLNPPALPTGLQRLAIESCDLDGGENDWFCRTLAKLRCLEVLDIDTCLVKKTAERILEIIGNSTSLRAIQLPYFDKDVYEDEADHYISCVSDAVRKNRFLQTVQIGEWDADEDDVLYPTMKSVLEAIGTGTQSDIRILYFGTPVLMPEEAVHIVNLLKQNYTIHVCHFTIKEGNKEENDYLLKQAATILKLNLYGRRYLVEGRSSSKGIRLLQSTIDDLDCIYFHLLENPSLCSIGNSAVHAKRKHGIRTESSSSCITKKLKPPPTSQKAFDSTDGIS